MLSTATIVTRDLDAVFEALGRSRFRRSFALGSKERDDLAARGIAAGRPLTADEQAHAVAAIARWLEQSCGSGNPSKPPASHDA